MTGWKYTRTFVINTLKVAKNVFLKVSFQEQCKMIKITTKGSMATNI